MRATRAPICVVQNGVAVSRDTDAATRAEMRRSLGCRPGDVVIGSIGRLDRNKNHAMLLRAFARMTPRGSNARLVVIGEGPERPALIASARELGLASTVLFAGAIPEAQTWWPAIDIGCLTSHSEGMPNMVMEAAAAGVPVVATRCGDTPELIRHGVSGYIVRTDDDAEMAACLQALVEDSALRHRLGAAGQAIMRGEFSVNGMVVRMMQLYEAALSERTAA
jgi:glycosyltransferase involved in cell wall biosynthesis